MRNENIETILKLNAVFDLAGDFKGFLTLIEIFASFPL
jgi:hypothetical protein